MAAVGGAVVALAVSEDLEGSAEARLEAVEPLGDFKSVEC